MRWIISNALLILSILDSTGLVVVKYVYDAWGNHWAYDGNGTQLSGSRYNIINPKRLCDINPFRYRGYYYDVETSLYYLQTRYYDPEVGRFISMDSIEYADPETINGLNLYAYCNNNPIMYIDPTGHFPILACLFAAFIGAAAAATTSVVVQLSTSGEINWGQIGISALFGAFGGLLSFTGIGGVVGQFVIQGGLAVGEMYSISALNGTVSSIGIEQIVATFLFAGALGAIGSKGAAAEFKRIGQIEADMIKYIIRDVRNGVSLIKAVIRRGAKYAKEFLLPLRKQAWLLGGITAMANISDYWIQRLYDNIV